MQQLNFKTYDFRFKNSENKVLIFDVIRKKFVLLTPEEWVRQHVICYLIHEKKYPITLINVEKVLTIYGMKKRYDIVVFHPTGNINILVECKATEIPISQQTFDQIARYNLSLKADYLMVTNGITHYFCAIKPRQTSYDFIADLPNYEMLSLQ